jgi:hypothetical protein
MTVLLSPVGGVAAQFFDDNGNPLSGGKLFSYAAGTTTPAATFTSSLGVTAHTNPIVLDSGGRVPGGETWLTDGIIYKFVLQTSTNVLIATYDNIVGINSNFVNYTAEQEIQTATAGQTVFDLTTMQYQPGTNSLTVYVDGVNQYGPGAQYAYLETDSDTVTFVSGLHVGASVKFTTATQTTGNATDASVVSYNPPFTGGVPTNVEAKLAQTVSVKDFGAVGDGVADDTVAIQAAINSGASQVNFPNGRYKTTTTINVPAHIYLIGQNYNLLECQIIYTNASSTDYVFSVAGPYNGIQGFYITTVNPTIGAIYRQDCSNSKDENIVIEGNFRYGWRHKHTGTGGYYNRHEKIFVALGASTYVDSVGIWCEGYYSASDFDSCSVTQAVTGMKFDHGNAVTLINPSVENVTTYGIYIGALTIGMSVIAPYFENNPVNNSIHCEAGAQTINVEWARSSQNIVNSITSRNQININGGLTASFQKYGFNNVIRNPQGFLRSTTGVPYWTASQATVTRESSSLSTSNDSIAAIRVTAAAGASNARISQQLFARTTTNTFKTFTISGRYFVPSGQTTDSRFRLIDTSTGTVLQAGLFTTKGSWQTFNDVFFATQPTQNFTLEIYAAFNAGGTTTGSEYVLVTDLCLVPGEYFVPNQEIPDYVTYQETALVTTAESDYQQPLEFCGFTAISSGATTVTVTYPTWFAADVTKIISCVATCGSNTAQAIKAEPTTTNVVFTVPSAPVGSFKIWYSIKAV